MYNLETIKSFFPPQVHGSVRSILREYLQYLVLQAIFSSDIASKLVFIGGTALRIVYDTNRFSEDLDFDNDDISLEEWDNLGILISKSIAAYGFNHELVNTRRNDTVFHHDLKFLGVLHQYDLSPHATEKIMIKIDSENQNIDYEPDIKTISKFGFIMNIRVMPLDIAVSQKIRAFMDREMGRDLFDLLSILPRSKPNYHYLEQALKISNPNEIKELILKRCDEINIDRTLSRTEPFLFNPDDVNRIKFFRNFVESYEF